MNYLKTHIFYVVLILAGLFFCRQWLLKHDARLRAEQTEQQANLKIADLQKTITQAQATAVVQNKHVDAVVKQAVTPQQQVEAIDQLSDVPLNTRLAPAIPDVVEVNTAALLQEMGKCKKAENDLQACQVTATAQEEQLKQKDQVIAAVKAKPKFWKRVGGRLKSLAWDVLIVEGVKVALTHKP